MKKPLRRLLALLAAGLLALLPTGCDGTTRSDTLQFTSFLTGEPVTVRLPSAQKVNPAGTAVGYNSFEADMSLYDLGDALGESNPGVQVEKCLDVSCVLLYADAFHVLSVTPFGEQHVVLSDMRAEVVYDLVDGEAQTTLVLLPYHLLSDGRLEPGHETRVYAGQEYETSHTAADFAAFYARAGVYTVEQQAEDTLHITGYRDTVPEGAAALRPFTLHFTEHLGQGYVAIRLD